MNIKLGKFKKDLFVEWLKYLYSRLNVSQKLHLNYIFLFAYALLLSFVLGYGQVFRPAFLFAILFWCIALVYDAIVLYKVIYESIIGKAFLTIMLVVGTNFSVSIAGTILNNVSGVEPSIFPHALIVISILTIPFITTLISLFLYYIIYLIILPFIILFFLLDNKLSNFLFPFINFRDDVYLKKTTVLLRTFSFGVFFVFIYTASQNAMSWYEHNLSKVAENIIYTFEMYPKSPCYLDGDKKSLFINDDMIITAKELGGEIFFKIEECNYKK